MDLNLYRRHRRGEGKCKAGHPPDSRSGEFEERKKGWRRCDCPIFASGVFPEEGFKRKSTDEWEWDKAKAVAAKWAETTPVQPPSPPSVLPLPRPSRIKDVPVSEAIEAYQKEHKDAGSSKGTKTRYDWLSRKVQRFSDEHGLVMCGDWTKAHVRLFRSGWGHGPRSTKKTFSQLKTFFAFCIDQDYIDHNPADIIQRKNVATDRGEEDKRTPYTDAELARMYDACHAYGGRKWTGEDLLDFIAVSVYTGLRISDVAVFHIDRLRPETGEVVLRAIKNGSPICTWIPTWLVKRIQYRAQKVGPYIFGSRKTADPNILGKPWRDRLNELWKLCGEWREKPVHHRFRHTFVRILLQDGNSYELVSELVGDTVQTLKRHYNQWVPERQAAITKALTDSFQDVPIPAYLTNSGAEVIAMRKPAKRQSVTTHGEAGQPAAAQF